MKPPGPFRHTLAALFIGTALGAAGLSCGAEEAARPGSTTPVSEDRYGDPLPPGAVGRLGTIRFRSADPVSALVFTTDGKTLISCGRAGLRFWDASSGRVIRTLAFPTDGGSPEGGSNFAFSADRKLIASVDNDSKIRFRDVDTGKELPAPAGDDQGDWRGARRVLALSPDGKTAAAALYQRTSPLTVWDVTSGRKLWSGDSSAGIFRVLAFSPDGKHLAEGGKDRLRLWNAATGTVERDWEGFVRRLRFSPDGKTLAAEVTQTGGGNYLRLWEVATGKELDAWRKQQVSAWSFGFSADGKAVFTAGQPGGGRGIRFWDVYAAREVSPRDMVADLHPCSGVAYSPDGKTLAQVAGGERMIQLWDLTTGKKRFQEAEEQTIGQVVFADDGKTLLTATKEGTVRQWDLADQTQRSAWRGRDVVLSPDGKTAVTGRHGEILVLEAATGKRLDTLKTKGYFADVTLAPGGKSVAASGGGADDEEKADRGGMTAYLQPLPNGKAIALWKNPHQLFYDCWLFCFSQDGRTLAGAHSGGDIRLWDVTTPRELGVFHCDRLAFAPERAVSAFKNGRPAFAPDGRTLAIALGSGIRILEVASGQVIRSIDFNDSDCHLPPLAYSPDGRFLVTGNGSRVLLHDLAVGKTVHTWAGHLAPVHTVAISGDSKTVASAGEDTTVLLWDVEAVLPRLRSQPMTEKQLQESWKTLADSDGRRAQDTVWTLVASAKQSVPLLKNQLPPVPASVEKTLAGWLADLDSDQFEVRTQAMQELEKQGKLAVPNLRRALRNRPSLDKATRLQQLLDKAEHRYSSEELRGLRALAVLERIGTGEAREMLEALAAGAKGAVLTEEARRVLQRLPR
ncbi:hypothetical protein AYO44_12315 [Planctomycetaceae bacterium SCGC AG-212-F19]|nr:hypothetical protein AYO44_12315 [Planctomycetaceae bacterium SCGC AG-212-F19]